MYLYLYWCRLELELASCEQVVGRPLPRRSHFVQSPNYPQAMAVGSLKLRGLRIALNSSNKYAFRPPEFQIDHLVIGGGMPRTLPFSFLVFLLPLSSQVSWDLPSPASLCSVILRKAHIS